MMVMLLIDAALVVGVGTGLYFNLWKWFKIRDDHFTKED